LNGFTTLLGGSELQMPSFQEFEAHVAVDGEPLPEYSPKLEVGPDGIMTASCWVPSEAGKVRDNYHK
jgi:hypothetical protein